eukprot:scaffold40115_cov58-Attheya_sp.AAC.3
MGLRRARRGSEQALWHCMALHGMAGGLHGMAVHGMAGVWPWHDSMAWQAGCMAWQCMAWQVPIGTVRDRHVLAVWRGPVLNGRNLNR